MRAVPKGEAASSSKGSATPKFSAASSSKGSVFVEPTAKSISKGSVRPKSPEKGSSKGSAKSKSVEGSSSSKGSAYPRCIDTSYLQGVKCWKFDDHDNLVEQQLSSIPVASNGKIVAFDWHHRYLSKAFQADWDTAELPQSVLDVYHQTVHSCGQFDKVIILSHIERGEKNLEFRLRSTRVNRLPVDLVFVTETRTGAGGKAAVLQALLGDRNITRSVLLDNNLQVCSEIERVGGIPLNIRTQRREHWSGRAAWNIGDRLQFVEEWLSQ